MRGAALFLTGAILGLVAGAVAAKVDSRVKFQDGLAAENCNNASCLHLDLRMKAIQNQALQISGPRYLAIGDSITEFAALPEICGRKPINAGISGATVGTFLPIISDLVSMAKPDFVVIALGTNDARLHREREFAANYARLIDSVGGPALVVPIPPSPGVPDAVLFSAQISRLGEAQAAPMRQVSSLDGIHLTAADYQSWRASIVAAAQHFCAKDTPRPDWL